MTKITSLSTAKLGKDEFGVDKSVSASRYGEVPRYQKR